MQRSMQWCTTSSPLQATFGLLRSIVIRPVTSKRKTPKIWLLTIADYSLSCFWICFKWCIPPIQGGTTYNMCLQCVLSLTTIAFCIGLARCDFKPTSRGPQLTKVTARVFDESRRLQIECDGVFDDGWELVGDDSETTTRLGRTLALQTNGKLSNRLTVVHVGNLHVTIIMITTTMMTSDDHGIRS